MKLPKKFVSRMKELLGPTGEFEPFIESFDSPSLRGFRANRLKITPSELKELLPFEMKPVRWCGGGFIYDEAERPAKT